jgi:hypothetical protein
MEEWGRMEEWNIGMMERCKSGKEQTQLASTKKHFEATLGGRVHGGCFSDCFLSGVARGLLWPFPAFQYPNIPLFQQLA